jgi:hypothetical protein
MGNAVMTKNRAIYPVAVLLLTLSLAFTPCSATQAREFSPDEQEFISLLQIDDDATRFAADKNLFMLMDETVSRHFLLSCRTRNPSRTIMRLQDPVFLGIVEEAKAQFLQEKTKQIEHLKRVPHLGVGAVYSLRKLGSSQRKLWLDYLRNEHGERAIRMHIRIWQLQSILSNWAIDTRTGNEYPLGPLWFHEYLKLAKLDAQFLEALHATNSQLAIRLKKYLTD